LQIMIEGPLGGAAFNNEFGRPALNGYFRTFEQNVNGDVKGFHMCFSRLLENYCLHTWLLRHCPRKLNYYIVRILLRHISNLFLTYQVALSY
ncbi:hypothetical protein, partial [Acinetobacter johnsonii]|uniref:hypothetical protein n=1 Tax=Acinetobacter johnsonii TaxID=40214 RepID=UPI00148F27CF